MLFSSFAFIFIFLPIVWIIFYLLKNAKFKSHYESAKIFLIISSLFFYAFWKVAYLPILLGSIIINYALAKAILRSTKTTIGGGGGDLDNIFAESALDSANQEKSSLRADSQNLHSKPPNYFVTRISTLASLARNDGNGLSPKFFFILGIIFNLSLLAFFKYTDFLLENFNAFSKLARLDFNIPLPHILLPLAISFVTFQQIAFLFDCFKRAKGELSENLNIDFIDYALFISFFPQLIAGPIVHHREMMPQFSALNGANSASFCDKSGRLATRFDDELNVLSSRSWLRNPNFSSKILEFASCKNAESRKNHNNFAESTLDSATHTKSAESNKKIKLKKPIKSFCYFWLLPKVESPLPLKHNPPSKVDSQNLGAESTTINYEFLAKGIFIFSIGLFKKVFIADSFAKWANAGFGIVEKGGVLNLAESWATSLSYTFQLYFDFSGYCDMAIGLALMFGIVLPLNFSSPYKSLNIAEFWRRWHITLGRFLRECLYIPLGGNRGKGNSSLTRPSRELEKSSLDGLKSYLCADFPAQPTNLAQDTRIANDSQKQSRITKILTLRNLFIVAFLSGLWHGAGWGFVIWGVLHGVAMVIHRIYSWILERNAKSIMCCHTERSEESKKNSSLRDFAKQNRGNPPYKKSQNSQQGWLLRNARKSFGLPRSHSLARNDDSILDSATRVQNAESRADSATRAKNTKLHFTQTRFYKILCWLLTFNFVNLAWVFFRAENLNGAMSLIKGMFGFSSEFPQKWSKAFSALNAQSNEILIWLICAFILCLVFKNAFEMLQNFKTPYFRFCASLQIFNKTLFIKCGAIFARFVLALALFYISIWIMLSNLISANTYTPFLYFNF